MPATAPSPTTRRAYLLIPIAVLLVLHPLLIHGPSCGQDLAFHVQSWLDAAQQLRHGTLYPHWDATAAWNAGEPRFLFYPPLSWLLGAILTLIFPTAACPTIFIAIALLASGLTFHKLASEFTSPNAALIASTLYLANPYMLFTAFERSALAELLAAAWIPLLLLALLHNRPTIHGVAIPLALLWLTNAPAAVIGSYTVAFLATLRVLSSLGTREARHPERSVAQSKNPEAYSQPQPPDLFRPGSPTPAQLALTYLAGAILGLTLPAIYLLPAAYERRYIQVAMAILPNLRYQDNFLFTHTPDAAHNAVNHTISLLALTLLLLTAAAVLILLKKSSPRKNSVILSEAHTGVPSGRSLLVGVESPQPKDPEELQPPETAHTFLPPTLALLTLTIALLLTPISIPIWHHLPNLAYLQFPWRFLTLLTPILALTIALLLDPLLHTLKLSPSAQDSPQDPGAPCPSPLGTWVRRTPSGPTTALTLLLPLALTAISYHLYHQPSDPTDDPATQAQLLSTHHGFPPTDEYTPTPADNDPLRTDNPAYWLLPLTANPNTPAPQTLPTPTELNPTLDTDDTPIPPTQTLSTPAPHHLTLALPQPSLLVLNLRDYPNWQVTLTTPNPQTQAQPSPSAQNHPPHIARNDGLLAIAVPTGHSILDITWRRTADQTLGLILSTISLLALSLTHRRKATA